MEMNVFITRMQLGMAHFLKPFFFHNHSCMKYAGRSPMLFSENNLFLTRTINYARCYLGKKKNKNPLKRKGRHYVFQRSQPVDSDCTGCCAQLCLCIFIAPLIHIDLMWQKKLNYSMNLL